MQPAVQMECETDLKISENGLAQVVFRGRLSARTVPDCWNTLEQKLRPAGVKTLEVDVSGVDFCGGAGFALLRYLNMGKMTPGATVSVTGLAGGFQRIFEGFTSQDYDAFHPHDRAKCRSLIEEAGHATGRTERRAAALP